MNDQQTTLAQKRDWAQFQIEEKYPVEKAKGRRVKYSKL